MRILSLFAVALLQIASLGAQVLNDFSAFTSTVATNFEGSWTISPPGPDAALGTFSQGAGVYNITGGTNGELSKANFYFLNSAQDALEPLNIGSNTSLALRAMLLPGNAATALTVTLYDSSASTHAASVSYDFSSFSSATYLTSVGALTADIGFDWSAIQSFSISGNMTGGTAALNISLDSLTAVPEPSTYAAILGLATLGFVGYRRYRRS